MLRNNTIKLKKEHKYYYQVTGLMGVCGIPKCYFLVWTPKELHIELTEFESGIWPNVLLKLELFFFKSYVAKVMLGLHAIYFWRVKNFLMTHLTTVFPVIIVLYGSTFILCKSAALRKSKNGSARLAWRIS